MHIQRHVDHTTPVNTHKDRAAAAAAEGIAESAQVRQAIND
jgi:hypothetical protein